MSNESAQALADAFAGAVAATAASLVSVSARRRFPASGIAWTENLVVTADHVIEQEEQITVRLPDGSEVPATVAGRDAGSDIAVLRVEAGGLKPYEAAPGSVRIGEPVFAVGRPGREPQASFGVVSTHGGAWRTATGGQVDGWVRAEVTMLPGFSGGPLIDLLGRVMGMNSSYLGRSGGLTIPVGALAPIVDALVKSGRLKRGYLGIGSQRVQLAEAQSDKLDGQETGLLVVGVEANSPAGGAGILVGDILVRMGEDRLEGTDDLQRALGPASVGKPTPVTIVRGGEPVTINVTIGERA